MFGLILIYTDYTEDIRFLISDSNNTVLLSGIAWFYDSERSACYRKMLRYTKIRTAVTMLYTTANPITTIGACRKMAILRYKKQSEAFLSNFVGLSKVRYKDFRKLSHWLRKP